MSQRVTQHRPKREKKNERDTNLKKEVEKLKRQVTKLRKELNKRDEIEEEVIDETPETEAPPKPTEKCPECGTDAKDVELIGKIFVICPECKWRKAK
jgi:formamidopyrimidine-DNA glycosylase